MRSADWGSLNCPSVGSTVVKVSLRNERSGRHELFSGMGSTV
jgi:hypothetical protein